MKKILTIVSILFITLFSSNIKAQSYVAGPTTVTKGEMNYFYIITNNTIAFDGYWFTSEDSTQHGFNYGNELSYFGDPDTLGDVGITFNTIGTHYIHVYYGGPSNPYGYASLAVTVVD